MEFPWSTLVWIAGLVFVYLFGLFEGRSQGYKKRKSEEEQERKEQPAPSSTPEKAETTTGDDPGLLRIKDVNGSYVLDLDGRRVNSSSLTADQRRRLIDMLSIMRPWLEGRSASGPVTPAAVSSRPATIDDRLDSLGSPTPQREPAPPPVPPIARQEAPRPVSRPSTIAKEDRPAAPANSIVSQIDSILQARLAGTSLEERGVFLAQSPEGGVSVYVGLTRYNGIDDLPDPEIKAAIRGAITEWENKYTPGL